MNSHYICAMPRSKEIIAFCCFLHLFYMKRGVSLLLWKQTKDIRWTYSYFSTNIYRFFLHLHFTLWNAWSRTNKGNLPFTCASSEYSYVDLHEHQNCSALSCSTRPQIYRTVHFLEISFWWSKLEIINIKYSFLYLDTQIQGKHL